MPDWLETITNSPLSAIAKLSPHHNSPRNHSITKITIHHTAGNIGLRALLDWLHRPTTRASYNYGISSKGEIGLIVEERNRCWGSSSAWNDNRAVVIGVANNSGAPEWTVSDAAFDALIDLCVDICTRNPGITQKDGSPGLYYDGTQEGSLTRHNMFSNQVCPGLYLQSRFPEICRRVNERLASSGTMTETISPPAYFPIHLQNIERMVELGVINAPGFWQSVDCIQWLDELLQNAGRENVLHKDIDNGITDLDTAIKVLEMAGVISSPGYWRSQAEKSSIQFLKQLIINIANRSRDPLHRIVWAEARGEDLKGQVAVANVVINRHNSSQFPTGIYNVIFQPNQFEPIRNGSYDIAEPFLATKAAVSIALSGYDYSRGALFFDSAENSWARQNRTHSHDIGGHSFFL